MWPLIDPIWPLHDLQPQQCTTLRPRILPTKSGSHRHSCVIWPLVDPCMTFHSSNALFFRLRFLLNLVVTRHSWVIWPLVDPSWPCMTFDLSNALLFSQGFFLLNFVAIGHRVTLWIQLLCIPFSRNVLPPSLVKGQLEFRFSKCSNWAQNWQDWSYMYNNPNWLNLLSMLSEVKGQVWIRFFNMFNLGLNVRLCILP